jgi:hypothetical protein
MSIDRRTFLAACLPLSLSAQLRPDEGRKLAQQALAALGGEAYRRMHHRVERGRAYSFYHGRLSGLTRATISTFYDMAPEPAPANFVGLHERQALGKDQDIVYLYTPAAAHEITYRGARLQTEEVLKRWKESLLHNVLYILHSRIDEPGIAYDAKGTDIYQNQPVDRLEIADQEGRAVLVLLDAQTHLPVRQSWVRRDPLSGLPVEEVTLFAKYRDIGGGVQWPWVFRRERNGERIFEMFADQVTVNPDLDESLFKIPKKAKILPPAK